MKQFFEDLELKRTVLSEIAEMLPQDAIIASNTSSISISDIAENLPNPERVVGMHFFNPVDKMPLVEIVRGTKTSNRTIATVAALTSKLGKYPIVVEGSPGFLINRILTPYLNEAGFLLCEGYSISDIDRAASDFGLPMGPLRLLDEVGFDVAVKVGMIMQKGFGDRMVGPDTIVKMLEHKRLGRKSSSGFYSYGESTSPDELGVREILTLPEPMAEPDMELITDRLIMSLINEAVLCLDEGVAGAPGVDAANQIDLGTVMGIGFPPFKGGIIYYANTLGSKQILDTLNKLRENFGERFAPCKGIKMRGETGRGFYS